MSAPKLDDSQIEEDNKRVQALVEEICRLMAQGKSLEEALAAQGLEVSERSKNYVKVLLSTGSHADVDEAKWEPPEKNWLTRPYDDGPQPCTVCHLPIACAQEAYLHQGWHYHRGIESGVDYTEVVNWSAPGKTQSGRLLRAVEEVSFHLHDIAEILISIDANLHTLSLQQPSYGLDEIALGTTLADVLEGRIPRVRAKKEPPRPADEIARILDEGGDRK